MGSCTYIWVWLGEFFMPWGFLCAFCGLCVLLPSALLSFWHLCNFFLVCISPLPPPPSPYHRSCAPSPSLQGAHGHAKISHWGTAPFSWPACSFILEQCVSSVSAPRECERISAGDVTGCSQLLVGSSENSEIVWCWSVWMDGRAEAFDIMVFAFSYFPKSDHWYLIFCCDLVGSFITWVQIINIKGDVKLTAYTEYCSTGGLFFSPTYTPHSTVLQVWIVWFILSLYTAASRWEFLAFFLVLVFGGFSKLCAFFQH